MEEEGDEDEDDQPPNQTVGNAVRGFRSGEGSIMTPSNNGGFSQTVVPEKKGAALAKGNKTTKDGQESTYALKPFIPVVPSLNHSSAGLNQLNIDPNNLISEKRGRITKDYQILELLGKGGFGEVKKVVHKLTRDVRAMKIIKKDKCDESYLATLTNEIRIMK